MEGGVPLSTITPSRPGRLLVALACVLGILAASLVLATLVLLAVDGHPGGLLVAVASAAVPVVLWGAWRLEQLMRIQKPTTMAKLDIRLESTSAPAPPIRTIRIFA